MSRIDLAINDSWRRQKYGFLAEEKKVSVRKVRHRDANYYIWMNTIGIEEINSKLELENKNDRTRNYILD